MIRSGLTGVALLTVLALSLNLAGCAGNATRASGEDFPAPAPPTARDAALADALRDYYQQWRGVPYRYGGQDSNGIDCSSFVRQTMNAVDSLALPRTTSQQADQGRAIARADLAPGDLVFFRTGRSSRHVGIYVGSGQFMHASSSHGVTISRLNNIYWRRHYWQSRRVLAASPFN